MSSGAETEELIFNSEEVRNLAALDMDFLAGLVAPDITRSAFPDYYKVIWELLTEAVLSEERKTYNFALGLPRGHAKTTVVKLAVMYAILFSDRKYILVIGANLKKAMAIIADVVDMLNSYNVQEVFGNWRYAAEKETQDLIKFSFNGRPVIIEAAGYGTSIRGSNHKNYRPDFLVFDDSQTKECSESIQESISYHGWFAGTALKAVSPDGALVVYIGNMYKEMEIRPNSGIYTCMLQNLKNSPEWTSLVVGAILEDGQALWPEVRSLDSLLAEFRRDRDLGQAEIFYAEVMNSPNNNFSYYVDINAIMARKAIPGELHQGNYIIIDPATSKATPDQVVIAYCEVFDDVPVIQEIHDGKYSSPQTVTTAIDLALLKDCRLIAVEANAYQYALCEWFRFTLEQMGIYGMEIVEIYNNGSKNSRILKMFKSLLAGEIRLSESSYAKVIYQAANFNPMKTNNIDDILDCVEMSLRVLAEHRSLMFVEGFSEVDYTVSKLPSQAQLPSPSIF